jgi:hypothetical protein
MILGRQNLKTLSVCLAFFFSPVILADLNSKMFDLSMSEETHSAFIASLQESLNLHPE